MASRKCRRLAQRLNDALKEMYSFEVYVDPEEIYPAAGWYRSSPMADCVRWEAYFRTKRGGAAMGSVSSYDRITDCARYGVKLYSDTRWNNQFDAYALRPQNKADG